MMTARTVVDPFVKIKAYKKSGRYLGSALGSEFKKRRLQLKLALRMRNTYDSTAH